MAGTSKPSIARTKPSRNVDASAGTSSGKVIRRVRVSTPAPADAAASSSDAFIDRSAAEMSRKASELRCRPSTKIIPHRL